MPKTMSVSGAFARLMRNADPNSSQNKKLIEAATVAANELCSRARIVIKEFSLKPHNAVESTAKDWSEWCLEPNSGSGWSHDWYILEKKNGEMKLISIRQGFGHPSGPSLFEAKVLARHIFNASGPTAWTNKMLENLKRYNK